MSASMWGLLDVRGYETARFLLSLLWQSSILLLGMAAVGFLLRRQPARVRHALWLAGLLCMPLLPLISWAGSHVGTPQRRVAVIPQYHEQFAPVAAPASPAPSFQSPFAMPPEAPHQVSQTTAQPVRHESLIPAPPMSPPSVTRAPAHAAPRARIYPWAWGVAAYAAIMAALVAWVLFGWLQMRRRLLRARVLNDARIGGILASAQEQAGVSHCVAVIESEAHAVPLTFGTFLPVIIAPYGLLAGLNDEEVRVLLLHELAHIRRRDAPMLMLVSLLRALFFFQPLAWVAARRVSILSEEAADDIVLEVTRQPVAYAKTLTRLAEELPRREIGIELSAGFVFSRGAFLGRVKAILADRTRVRVFSRGTLVGTIAAIVVVLCITIAVPMSEKSPSVLGKNHKLPPATEQEARVRIVIKATTDWCAVGVSDSVTVERIVEEPRFTWGSKPGYRTYVSPVDDAEWPHNASETLVWIVRKPTNDMTPVTTEMELVLKAVPGKKEEAFYFAKGWGGNATVSAWNDSGKLLFDQSAGNGGDQTHPWAQPPTVVPFERLFSEKTATTRDSAKNAIGATSVEPAGMQVVSTGRNAPEAQAQPRKTPSMAWQAASDILKNHFIRDAVMLVPNGTWHSAPALADIAGNGTLQVIAPVGERWVGAWFCDGRPVPGWPQECGRICCPVAVGDVFHDGKLEIASPGHLWRADGQLVQGWPQGDGNWFCAPSLADLEGDGRLEILESDKLGVCIRRGDGTMLPGWPIAVPDNDVRSTPLAFDLLGDGKKEIIFLRHEGEVRIYMLDGKPLRDYPKRFRLGWQQSFVLTETGNLVAGGALVDLLKGTTTTLPGRAGGNAPCLLKDPETGEFTNLGPSGDGYYDDSAVAADIAGDGKVATLYGGRDGVHHAMRQDGTEAPGWPKLLTPAGDSGMAVGNLSGDTLQVVSNADGGRIYVFDEPAPATTPIPWPMFMANNLRNGMPGHPDVPRATATIPAAGEKALELRKALSQGNWDAAISIYREALAAVRQNATRFEAAEAARMEQAGLLSIARVLNTRAKRFDEAAAFYRQAIEAAPDTWPACQALIECMDLARLHPDATQAKAAFEGAIDACLPALKAAGDEADLRRYAAAQACAQAGRSEGTALLEALEQDASPVVASMAKSFTDYDGLPFLLNLSECQWHTADVKTKDLKPEDKAQSKVELLLEIAPNSPASEDFPVTLWLKAPADEAAKLGAGWQAGADGQLQRQVERKLVSAPLGTFRGSRELLSSWSESLDSVTVRREVSRVDKRHMHVKIFFQSTLPSPAFSFSTSGTGARIDPASVTPGGAFYNNEGEVRFISRGGDNDTVDLAAGVTVEATVELPEGTGCFYPEAWVGGWGADEEIQVEPRTATDSVRGQIEKIQYEITSKRGFKVISAARRANWRCTLARLTGDAAAERPYVATNPPPSAGQPRQGNVAPALSAQGKTVNLRNGTDADLAALKDVQQITTLDLSDSDVTDAGLARLEEMTGLKQLDLNRCANITDAGLTHLKPLKNLRRLSLFGDHITDAGLANLKDLVDLQTLQLFGSDQITDHGLANIAAMKHLKDLNLSGSQITDSGLTSLDDLKLQGLWLDDCNGITDAGMPCLAKMTSLRRLGLDRTQLTDAGLKQLSSLKDLDTLSLDGTRITDAGLANLKDMRRMAVLGLWSCKRITDAGLANLQGMNSLITVYLDDTNVTDAGLENLKGLHRLAYLGLGQTQIGDAGIANLKDLDTLEMLRIEKTRVTDAGLTNLKGMRRLRSLGLSNCTRITDGAVAHLKEMKSLQQIALYGISISDGALADLKAALPKAQILVTPKTQNQAPSDQSEQTNPARVQPAQGTTVTLRNGTDADLAALKDVQQITRLDLSDSSVTDAGLARLKEMTGLRELSLNNCTNITDVGLINLKDCKNLTALSIGNTRITEAGLALLKEMKGLQVLDLRFTKITPGGLAHVKEMKSLTNLVLQGTGMTDAGLEELKEMKTLDYLDLYGTKVTDAGLAQLKQMNGLTSLDLGGTPVTDAGLAQLKEIQGLKWLDLSWTRVTDVGLMDLKEMKGLQSLDLSCTNVTDAGIGLLKEMKGLEAFCLRKTKLTDAGLANLEEMNGIQTLDLSDTSITGDGLGNLKGLNNLMYLELSGCRQLKDSAVTCLKELKQLRELDLRQTNLSAAELAAIRKALANTRVMTDQTWQGTKPSPQAQGSDVRLSNATDADLAALKNLDEITSFWISGRNVTDAGLARLEEMPNLERINLVNCYSITDAALAHLKPLQKLKYLFIFGARITDDGLPNLEGLTQLKDFRLDGCSRITDAALGHLSGMRNLHTIGLGGTQVTDAGLAQLAERRNLISLLLGFTHITDVGLAHVRNLRLQVLDLQHCPDITDAGLANLKEMTSLYDLSLADTATTDAGLANLKGLTAMGVLTLDQCSGISDAGLVNSKGMNKLLRLSLSQCSKITDAGLANFSEMTGLESLNLSGCTQITDAGLDCLKNLKQLRRLDLSGTKATAAGIARLKAALPQAQIVSGEMPAEPPRQALAPAAVTKAIMVEWPDADLRDINQRDNYPGWEPKKIWRAVLERKGGPRGQSIFVAMLTDAGQVIRVTNNFEGAQASDVLPKAVADAMTATLAGAKCDSGTRLELRADRTMAELPEPNVRYVLQVTGSDAMARLSISEDGKDVKVIWKTPPEVFRAIQGLFHGSLKLIRPVPLAAGSPFGWQVFERAPDDRSDTTVTLTEHGDIKEIMTQFRTRRQMENAAQLGIPQAVAATAVAALPRGENDSGSFVKTEKRLGDDLAKLPQPVITYSYSSGTAGVYLTESGAVIGISTRLGIADASAAVSAAAKAACPGATFTLVQRVEMRADAKTLTPLVKPVVTYVFHYALHEEIGLINVSEAGVVNHLYRALTVAELPSAVAKAVAQAVPGGIITHASREENRLDKTMAPLPQPAVTYSVAVDQEDKGLLLTVDEDGHITQKQTRPTWEELLM
jgi:beta-lactamase regulating signal transducer with metallopeptidase domain/Leucine-rich repeat (LRR) protein/tetratricopeptide (TPR) repeat protein